MESTQKTDIELFFDIDGDPSPWRRSLLCSIRKRVPDFEFSWGGIRKHWNPSPLGVFYRHWISAIGISARIE